MARQRMTGLLVNGSVRSAGVTFYTKQGRTVVRAAHSMQPERRTRAQFDVRMRIKQTTYLWQILKQSGTTLFYGGKSAYARFASLAFRLPVVYLPSRGPLEGATLLLPEMPLSDGTLPTVKQWLGELPLLSPADSSPKAGEQQGRAALLTNLKRDRLKHGDRLLLYTVLQQVRNECPRVIISVRDVALDEMVTVDGTLALVGEEFADTMRGWALVHVRGEQCSSQTAVTRCTYYQQFTTEEAMLEAVKTYGGLKGQR